MQAPLSADNLRIYNDPKVASHYAGLDYLTPCERFLFDKYVPSRASILDIGVGGGRTTPHLSAKAACYAGVDYSEEMIQVCRARFPQLEFFLTDASDLSIFPDAAFDAIVMAFNGMDYVLPEEKRGQCLRECKRVLRTQGVLIFSSHNPRAILVRPAWDRGKLSAFAGKLVGEHSPLFQPVLSSITVAKAMQASLRAAATSLDRVARRITKSAFWRGEGYLLDPSHGGLTTHCWVPQRVVAELTRSGFQLAEVMGDDYPSRSSVFVTDWYYYVFQK